MDFMGIGAHMDHEMPGMDHDMPDMPDMPMHDMCSMNMLFTWDYTNTCVVFKWWHIRSIYSFLISFLAVIVLALGYEFLRYRTSLWDNRQKAILEASAINTRSLNLYKLKKSFIYGCQVGYLFLLMLVFMTYNGWLMIAVAVGAAIGHFIWGINSNDRGMECH